jgi:hypothetical protein
VYTEKMEFAMCQRHYFRILILGSDEKRNARVHVLRWNIYMRHVGIIGASS